MVYRLSSNTEAPSLWKTVCLCDGATFQTVVGTRWQCHPVIKPSILCYQNSILTSVLNKHPHSSDRHMLFSSFAASPLLSVCYETLRTRYVSQPVNSATENTHTVLHIISYTTELFQEIFYGLSRTVIGDVLISETIDAFLHFSFWLRKWGWTCLSASIISGRLS